MTEDLSEEKRVWYLKGYEQAERDCEALIKKLAKNISDLSAERLALLDDTDLFGKPQEVERKLNAEIDALKDLLNTAYGVIDSDYYGTEEHLVLRREMEAVLDKGE